MCDLVLFPHFKLTEKRLFDLLNSTAYGLKLFVSLSCVRFKLETQIFGD